MIHLAIDPGEVHCGIYVEQGQYPTTATLDPINLADWLTTYLEVPAVLVLEEFRLYPWKMQEQGYSQLKTVETIGVIRHICRRTGTRLVEQSATIKKPTFAVMNARGVKLVGRNQHEKDAQAHMYYYRERGCPSG